MRPWHLLLDRGREGGLRCEARGRGRPPLESWNLNLSMPGSLMAHSVARTRAGAGGCPTMSHLRPPWGRSEVTGSLGWKHAPSLLPRRQCPQQTEKPEPIWTRPRDRPQLPEPGREWPLDVCSPTASLAGVSPEALDGAQPPEEAASAAKPSPVISG